MIDYYETKQHPITKKMVLDAYPKYGQIRVVLGLIHRAWKSLRNGYRIIYIKSGTV